MIQAPRLLGWLPPWSDVPSLQDLANQFNLRSGSQHVGAVSGFGFRLSGSGFGFRI